MMTTKNKLPSNNPNYHSILAPGRLANGSEIIFTLILIDDHDQIIIMMMTSVKMNVSSHHPIVLHFVIEAGS